MPGKGKINNLQLEAVWLLLRDSLTITEMVAKLDLNERRSIRLALGRLEAHGLAKVVGWRKLEKVWGLIWPEESEKTKF